MMSGEILLQSKLSMLRLSIYKGNFFVPTMINEILMVKYGILLGKNELIIDDLPNCFQLCSINLKGFFRLQRYKFDVKINELKIMKDIYTFCNNLISFQMISVILNLPF